MWTKTIVYLMLICSFYFLVNFLFFTDYPPVWPDEAEYADVSLNVLKSGQMKTELFNEIYQDKTINSYPPILFYFYAGLYKLFGFSIEVQRTFAIISGLLFLVISYFILNKLLNNHWSIYVSLGLLLTDWTFMRAARVSRPEIFVMLLSFIGFLIILNSKKTRQSLISGILFGLAFLIHPFAILNIIITVVFLIFRDRFGAIKKLILFFIPLFLALVFWLSLLNFNIGYFLEGIHTQELRKAMEPGYFTQFFYVQDYGYVFLNLSLIFGSVFSLIYLMANKNIKFRSFLIIALIVSWLFIFKGKQGWYYVYPIPFIYFSYGVIIKNEFKNIKTSIVPYVAIVLMALSTVLNSKLNYQFFAMFQNGAFSYELFNKSVLAAIPDNSTVFISSIPDPYFALKKEKKVNLRHFIAGPGLKDKYLETLDKSDYVVYTGALDLVYGDMLDKYLNANKQIVMPIDNGANQYQGLIIKLKPTLRVYPK